ncbi:MAG: hypothetical protein MRY32_06455 [Rickettsiales bacterium]|nr:hypothetical protein [Rickettsiales bacterium]
MEEYNYNPDAYEVSSPGVGMKLVKGLRSFGGFLTLLPFNIGNIAFGWNVIPATKALAGIIESATSLTQGQYSKAGKELLSSAADTAVVSLGVSTGLIGFGSYWLGNAVWKTVAGNTLGEQARITTNWALDSADEALSNSRLTQNARNAKVLGDSPQTRGSVVAGTGFSPELEQSLQYGNDNALDYREEIAQAEHMPGKFTTAYAQEKGLDPQAKFQDWARDEDNRSDWRKYERVRAAARAEQQQAATVSS